MPTVREVFERAYGPVPEGATCHVGGGPGRAKIRLRGTWLSWLNIHQDWEECTRQPFEHDISDRDAEAFRGFFDAAYDAALDALTKAQPDPRRVIALADAMAVEFRQFGKYGRGVSYAIGRYMEASREFWAALSADGTGESPVLSTHLDVMGKGK